MIETRVISGDSHVQEPKEMYTARLPEQYMSRLPHVEEIDGVRYRMVEGRKPRRLDIAEARETEEDRVREFRDDDSGGRDLERRLADIAKDGIYGEIIYPNETLGLHKSFDAGYQFAVAQAYNDWAIELFRDHLHRFVPVGVIPVTDIPAAVEEVKRASKLGYRAVKIPISVRGRPYNQPDYEPLWQAVEDAGLVLNLHAFTDSEDTYPDDWGEENGFGGALNFMVMSMAAGLEPASMLISSGMLERHPGINLGVIECGAGWLAWLLYALDEQVEKKHMWISPKLAMKPSDYFRRQGHVTFGDDPVALLTIPVLGDDCLVWGSDYPHDEGTFPHSQEVIEKTFQPVSEESKRKIVYGNAARIYGIG